VWRCVTVGGVRSSTVDPLFSDAPDAGTGDGYEWRKARGTVCDGCGEPIVGRRFEIKPLFLMGADRVPPDAWFHAQCFDWEGLAERRADHDRWTHQMWRRP